MPLTSGARLGPYSIDYPLGAGGMGEVYCATDTTLSRQVAIKVLPEALANDPERLARFDREARTLAALNHPNIAAIYGVERSGAASALVMELVEGPTLADRIALGAIPLDEVVPIALQIAKALEAAHEQGIIHRDLKPANIKVRADGTVKVLDFGLAKALGPETSASAGGSATLSPTITSPAMMTGVGIILGTAAYMSPEQARGRTVDRRADIWAFGAVLFEMLSGERAFAGEDVSDTLADVMRVEPAWTKLPDSIPPALLTFLKRCLRKNPAERVRDIGDVRLALEGAFDTVASPVIGAAPPAPPAPHPLWRRVLPIAAALIATVGAAAAAWYLKPAEARPVVRINHVMPPGRTFRAIGRQVLAVSPDGRQIVYNGTGGLFVRSLDGLVDRLIPGTEGSITGPVFSPDGSSLAFFQDDQIRRISITGGASVPLARAANPGGMSWETDGSILYSLRNGLWQVPETGGEPKRLIEFKENGALVFPHRLPGSDWILVTAFRAANQQQPEGDAVAVLPETGEQRIVRKSAFGASYAASGHLLYLNNGVLYAVPFDPKRVAVTGGPVPVVEGMRTVTGFPIGQFAVSRSGTLAFVPGPVGTSNTRLSLATADVAGVVTPIKGLDPGPYVHVRATHDGKRLAVDSDDGKESIVWIYEMGGTAAMRRLTFGGRNAYPVWSPDGRRIAFQSDRDGDAAIYVQNADGTGTVERLTRPEKGDAHIPESWSPDGRYLSFSVVNRDGFALWIFSFDERKPTSFRDVQSSEPTGSVISPDGKWIAYHVRPDGIPQNAPAAGVFVESFPPTAARARYQAPRVNFDFQPVWSHDGKELLYIPSTASARMATGRFTSTPAVTLGTPSTFPFTLTAGKLSGGRRAFDVLPNGNIVSLSVEGESTLALTSANEFRIVVNWFDELRRLAPVR